MIPSSKADDARAAQIYLNIQLLLAGESTKTAWVAVQMSLEAVIGFSCADIAEVDRCCDALAGDLKKNIRLNWDETREARTRAFPITRT